MTFTEGDLRSALLDYARQYRIKSNESLRRASHMNEDIMKNRADLEQELVDALLVDFINFIGSERGGNYGIYTKHLKEPLKVIYL